MKKLLKNKIFWVVLGITLFGAFLRAYNFEDWMHYQLDQARDFRVVHAAIVYGPGELPLQGPRAAGSFLRLGPLLYYLEYGSALVFGDTPAGSVMIILILNILAIPLFYVFLRRFFERKLSLGLTGIFAVSLFMIVYSRFGWNPTLVPFFMILFAYALLRVTDDDRNSGWWLVGAAGALAFIANMHFVAFVTVPVIAIAYFIWTRPRIKWTWWLLAIGVFIFLNVPLIVNDIKTGGENTKEFVDVALNRSGGDNKNTHNIVDKAVRNVGMHTQYYWLVLTGNQFAVLPELNGRDIRCNYDCKHGLVFGSVSFVMIFFGIIGWIFLYKNEQDINKKNFLRLVFLWEFIVFAVYTPLAYDIAPRFFLLNVPLMFIMLGFVLNVISTRHKKIGSIFVIGVSVICIASNLFFVQKYYRELAQASTNKNFVLNHSDKILKEKTRVTFSQMMTITDWMVEKYEQNEEPIFMYGQPEYKRAFWERIDVRDISRDHIPKDLDPIYREGNYFIVIRTQSNQDSFLENFLKCLDIIEQKNFGTLTAYYFKPKEECITDEQKVFEEKSRDPKFSKDVQPRYLWRQVFEGCTYNQKTDKCEK